MQQNVGGKIELRMVSFGERRSGATCRGWWDGEEADGGWSVGERCP